MDITLSISYDSFSLLKDRVNSLQITPEELVRISIDELLSRPDEQFKSAAEYVLKKNSELYRRLA